MMWWKRKGSYDTGQGERTVPVNPRDFGPGTDVFPVVDVPPEQVRPLIEPNMDKARVSLTFEDYQTIRGALAEAKGALRVTAKAAGKSINQSGAEAVLITIQNASDLLHERAFPV